MTENISIKDDNPRSSRVLNNSNMAQNYNFCSTNQLFAMTESWRQS